MELFRIVSERYSEHLSASGSANRWNKKGEFVIYAGSTRALSTLELIVHRSAIHPIKSYRVMVISIPDDTKYLSEIKMDSLPQNWQSINSYPILQNLGSNWYNQQTSLILKVPSSIIPLEYNYIINTIHPQFSKQVRLVRLENYFWDARLF